jgi:hypothetical protein
MVEDAADSRHNRSLVVLERTDSPTSRTCLLLTQLAGLLLRRHLQGARQQRLHGRHRHFLHLRQVNVQAWTLLAPLLPHDDSSPALGKFLDPANILGCRFACCHVASLQEFG